MTKTRKNHKGGRHFPRKGFVGPPPSSKVCKTFSIIFLIILSRNLSSSKVCKTHGLVWSWTSPGTASRRLQLHAPATPRAQSKCIARIARTFSIGTPRTTSPRGCFEGSLRTLNTRPLLFKSVQNSWPCLKLNLPRRRFAVPAAPCACNATCPVRVHRLLHSHLLYWNTTHD